MKQQNNRKLQGFSLIELMVVIAIISILAGIATPLYFNYLVRSYVSNALPILDNFKNKATDFYNTNNRFPSTLADLDVVNYSDNLVASVMISNSSTYNTISNSIGYIEITFQNNAKIPTEIRGQHLALVAIDSSSTTTWQCASRDLNSSYLPNICQ